MWRRESPWSFGPSPHAIRLLNGLLFVAASAASYWRLCGVVLVPRLVEERGKPLVQPEMCPGLAGGVVAEPLVGQLVGDQAVRGITIWGYVVNRTWIEGSGLIQENGTPRPAMTWLMNYLRDNPKP